MNQAASSPDSRVIVSMDGRVVSGRIVYVCIQGLTTIVASYLCFELELRTGTLQHVD